MTIQDLGSIGEFVAAITTLVTLLYLAIQIRQNTRSVRSSTYQAVLDSFNHMNQLLGEPDLQRIYRMGRKDPKQLNEDELIPAVMRTSSQSRRRATRATRQACRPLRSAAS